MSRLILPVAVAVLVPVLLVYLCGALIYFDFGWIASVSENERGDAVAVMVALQWAGLCAALELT